MRSTDARQSSASFVQDPDGRLTLRPIGDCRLHDVAIDFAPTTFDGTVSCAATFAVSRARHKRCTAPSAMDTASPAKTMTELILRQGVVAAQNCEYDRARGLLQQVIAESPNDVIAWYWMAIASESADAAIPCLRRVLAIDDGHAPARDALARLLIAEARGAAASGKRDVVAPLVMEAASLTPDVPAPWQAMADLATSQVERINALRRLVAIVPGDPSRRTQLRQALLARAVTIASDDRVEARSRFREAAILSPNDVRIWQALCNLADSEDERLQSLRELLRVAPHHDEGRAALRKALIASARNLATAGDIRASLDRWYEAIEITGGDVEVWLGIASTTEDKEEAARAIESAQGLNANDPRIAAAIEWLHGPQVDPSVLPEPEAAFARFEDAAAAPGAMPEPDLDDALLDKIAALPPSEPEDAPAPIVATAAVEPPAEVAPAPATDVAPMLAEQPPAASPAAAPGDATVMIVDDSPTIRKILALTLERAGYRVVAEADGTAALERLREVVPQAILLDIAMPDLDGYEVCKRIKQDPRTQAVPVIMLSGKGAFFDKVKGHMAGATEYLTKPFETPAVLAVVASHCQAEVHHG
jgi:twitching motility two-component system response regulator PilG